LEASLTIHLAIYDAKPWQAAYGSTITAELPAPRFQNLAEMVHSACERYAPQKAFTCVMPNGMNGTLTYAQVGRLSD
jgi:long-chain acyl-CoA synthetase